MVVNINKTQRSLFIVDRAMGGYWTSPEMEKFKAGVQRMDWKLAVLPCEQHKIREQECGIAMLRDMEVYFCMKGGHRPHSLDELLNAPFDVPEAKHVLKVLFEALRENCDKYLDYILQMGSLFIS